MHAAPADAGRLSSPAQSRTLPDFLALAEPALLRLWLAGVDCELPAGSIPKHRMSRAGFYSTNPSRRPIHVRIANKVLILESWSGYLRRLAAMDAATAARDPAPATLPVRRARGRPRKSPPRVIEMTK